MMEYCDECYHDRDALISSIVAPESQCCVKCGLLTYDKSG